MRVVHGALAPTDGGPGARSRAPGGVQGQRPGGGRGGEAPRSQRAPVLSKPLEKPFQRIIIAIIKAINDVLKSKFFDNFV